MDRLKSLEKALSKLKEAILQTENEIARDATIKRFEFTFELAWKSLKDCLRLEGVDVTSPRSSLKEAFKMGWLEDDENWLLMLEDRNLSAHIYDEETAKAIYQRTKSYLPLLENLFKALKERSANETNPK